MDEYDHGNQQNPPNTRNCTLNCSNSLRILELSQTVSNLCSQKIELNNPDVRCVYGISCRDCIMHTIIYGVHIYGSGQP